MEKKWVKKKRRKNYSKYYERAQTLINIKVSYPRSKPKWLHYYDICK